MTLFLSVYAAGIVCMLGQLHGLIQRTPGRHRAGGRMSWPAAIALRAEIEVSKIRYARFQQLRDQRTFPPFAPIPSLVDEAPTQPIRAYAHNLGAGRYAHLRIEELTATAERKLRLADFEERRRGQVVDLAALRVRGSVPTVVEVDDEWWAAVVAS